MNADILAAEEKLLSAILGTADADLVRRCDDLEFTQPELAAVFDALKSMLADGRDLSDVFEIARRSRRPHTEILSLSSVVGPAQASAEFEANRSLCHEAHLRRHLACIGAELKEVDVTDRAKLARLIQRTEQVMQAAAFGSGPAGVLVEIESRRATVDRQVREPVPVLALNGIVVTTRGSISMMTAQKKNGKTAAIGGAMGATVGGPEATGDTLGFTSHNPEGHAVIHLDTEQSLADHDRLFRTILARAGMKAPPPWFYSYCLTGMSVSDVWRVLRSLTFALKQIHGGIFSIVIDGIGDIVSDPNDAEESNGAVAMLYEIAVRFDCSVMGVLHLNPASKDNLAKSRGHLGSQMERKVEVDLRVTKDADEVSRIFTACARHKPIAEADGPCFKWDNDAGMHVTAGASVPPELLDITREVFKEETLLGHNELERKIRGFTDASESTAKRTIKKMVGFKLIEKASGFYRQRRAA